MLVKTTPEVVLALPLGLLVAVFARDGRAFVLRGLLITYILPLALILISPKKTSRYFLPFLPLLLTLATFGFVWLGQRVRRYLLRWQILGVRHLREHLFLAALVAGIVIVVARGARIANVWPLPITWCSTLPGRPAEELVTLGWGEGMKEVALWLKSNTSTDNPRVWGSIYVSCMSPWMSFHHVDQPTQAQFVVRYLSEEQRGVGQNTLLRLVLNNLAPLHEVWLAGRLYARIYPGPKHSGYYTHKTGQPRSWP
jgi:hypothetical protein